MVFQNPDNQIIGTGGGRGCWLWTGESGSTDQRRSGSGWKKVLKAVGMYEYRKHSPNKLSGGQKQRVAIAGVMAMHPQCIILDEPTAMLDPNGRKEVIRAVHDLNDEEEHYGYSDHPLYGRSH